jgi:biopolymer transport protein ExbB
MKPFALVLVMLLYGCQAWAADFGLAAKETEADLNRARQELSSTRSKSAQKEARLKGELAKLKAAIKTETALQASLQKELARISLERTQAAKVLREVSGDLREMAGHVRTAARELLSAAENSPVSAEYPKRMAKLKAVLQKGRMPGLGDIEQVIGLYQQETKAASSIRRRQGTIVDTAGRQTGAEILRIGVFTTIYRNKAEVGFLLPGPDPRRLLAVKGQMPWGMKDSLQSLMDGATNAAPLDISGGAALRSLARVPSVQQRIKSGGPLVWPILGVGALALLLLIERFFFLQRVRFNTDELMGRVSGYLLKGDLDSARESARAKKGRPVANVILAGLRLIGRSPETIETGLGEAMLRELPRLERSLTVLKVLAAVAPLLGLLGTVTGMINTFQVITVHGSGDPRLMAGGISEALITTQLGLAVAIPIMVFAALLSRRAQKAAGDMEEKALHLNAALIQAGGRS